MSSIARPTTPPSPSLLISSTSYPKNKINVLLLENVHQAAIDLFNKETFSVESHKGSLPLEQLKEKVQDAHIIGIRSKTRITAELLQHAKKLKAVGCFCIGTDQVDLAACEARGVPVFNSPFANTRSVAELVMAEIVFLARKAGDRSSELHKGIWTKSAAGCFEVRGKTLGIVGYGHVGSQVSLLAESFGMNVKYFDVVTKLPLGNADPADTLEDILTTCDFVSLHVPKTEQTNNLITKKELQMMKKGSYLLNLSRGSVVNVQDLADALNSEHLAGAAVDVYPEEPEENTNTFKTPLQGCPNTILTPHVGGSTAEAQRSIGIDVAKKLISYMNEGNTAHSVNFPQVTPTNYPGCHRILNVHKNQPGVLRAINEVLSIYNVSSQYLGTTKTIGYLIVDVDQSVSHEVLKKIKEFSFNIQLRILY